MVDCIPARFWSLETWGCLLDLQFDVACLLGVVTCLPGTVAPPVAYPAQWVRVGSGLAWQCYAAGFPYVPGTCFMQGGDTHVAHC